MKRLGLAVAVLISAGCVQPMARDAGSSEEIREALDEAQRPAASAPPDEVRDALLPEARQGIRDLAAVPEQRFDIDVDEAGARSFFMGLVRGTHYNMVVHPEVTGKISLSLNNVTVTEVMEIVRDVYGYEYQKRDDSFLILPAQLRTQVFNVNYLNVRRSGESRTRVSSGQATESPQAILGGFGGGFPDATGRSGGGVSGDRPQDSMSSSRIETKTDSDFWQELKNTLESMIGTRDGRNVVINAQTGTIVVRAMSGELREIADYLASVQAISQRQVVLEAKVIEVELRDGFESGINWSALARDGSTRVTAGVIRGRDLFSGREGGLSGRQTLGPDGAAPSFSGQAFGGAFGIGVNTRSFEGFLELLETQGRTQVLSSPRTTAINNQKSVIKVGTDEFFFTGISSLATTGSVGATTSRNVQVAPFFSGIALDVTPQISADDEVILHIHPSVSEVSDQTKIFTSEGREESIPLALSTIRESDSIVRARSGQMIVIGGLMRTSSRNDVDGIPVLSRLPLIGGLARHQRTQEVKSELVILLRPIVVNDDADWYDMLREQRGRSGELMRRQPAR